MSRQLQHQRKGQVNQDGHWTPPPCGVLKINTDGSSRGNLGPVGIGGVVRCSSGDVKFFSQFIRVLTLIILWKPKLSYMLWNSVACGDGVRLSVSLIPKWW